MTVMRLGDGRLILHSPVKLDENLRENLETLGRPAFIIAPNRFHHLFVADYLLAFPDAQLYLAPGLEVKRPELKFHGILPEAAPAQWQHELSVRLFRGAPSLNEIVVYHHSSRSLVLTDLAINFRQVDSLVLRMYLKLNRANDRVVTPVLVKLLTRDRASAKQSVKEILSWDVSRIILSHGEIVETHVQFILEDLFGWVLASN